jgi:FtsP/CotA-like multicopper oxidase with cupredoxin domain
MEPYRPNYYMVNGRSMPDDMDTAYSVSFPNQPYNGNPHMHPGELVLMRVVGQGHWQHPFHFHGNHARVLARDANLLLSQTSNKLAGPLLFTIATVSGQTVDAIFTWTGQGLNWDVYGMDSSGHTCKGKDAFDSAGRNKFTTPASNYDPTSVGFDAATHEYCLDHGKPIPITPPDPSIVVNGQWYGGTPYIGLQSANATPEAPGTLNQNPQAGYAYMWHSHNEREITTNDVFPGGMMMMLLIDPAAWTIDETQ